MTSGTKRKSKHRARDFSLFQIFFFSIFVTPRYWKDYNELQGHLITLREEKHGLQLSIEKSTTVRTSEPFSHAYV